MMEKFYGTTIIAIKRDGKTVVAGDGQVTMGNSIIKASARKVRRLYNDKVLAGFAGSTADAFALFEKFEGKLKEFNGNLVKSAVELAKEWRTSKMLRYLEALLVVADKDHLLLISGTGDVLEPDEPVIAIGSGGNYALAAARALLTHTNLSAREIALESLKIASDICIYTNSNFVVEEL